MIKTELLTTFEDWMKLMNQGELSNIGLAEGVVLFYEREAVKQGAAEFLKTYQTLIETKGEMSEREILKQVKINQTPDLIFEIGRFQFSNGETYATLTGWRYFETTWCREIEVISACTVKDMPIDFLTELDTARETWANIASEKGAAELIRTLYTEDCHYFNRGTLYSGRENLQKVYSYMDDERYSVSLSAIYSFPVTETLVFELGTWMTNGLGDQYLAIWEKCDDQCDAVESPKWQMRLDSNW